MAYFEKVLQTDPPTYTLRTTLCRQITDMRGQTDKNCLFSNKRYRQGGQTERLMKHSFMTIDIDSFRVIHSHTQSYIVIYHIQSYIVIYWHTQSHKVIQSYTESYIVKHSHLQSSIVKHSHFMVQQSNIELNRVIQSHSEPYIVTHIHTYS